MYLDPDPEHYLNPKITAILLNTTSMLLISKSSKILRIILGLYKYVGTKTVYGAKYTVKLKRWIEMGISLDCSTDGARLSKEDHSSVLVVRFGSTLRSLLANTGKASNCHNERKKSRRYVMEVAFIAVLAFKGKGDGAKASDRDSFVVFTLLALYSAGLLQCFAKSDLNSRPAL
jgi:hypothetical protein